ncbi:MAG: methytransferase partner Trm112 [Thermoplasmata archaeon]
MKRNLLDILCCPVDQADLELSVFKEEEEEIVEGCLTCTKCKFEYLIRGGIPNMLPPWMQKEEKEK